MVVGDAFGSRIISGDQYLCPGRLPFALRWRTDTTQHRLPYFVKIPTYHTAIVLRAILLILVIATQIVVPVAGRPLVCGPECGQTHETSRCDADDTGDDGCERGSCAGDHHERSPGTEHPEQGDGSGCFPYGCPCCAVLMLPGTFPLPEASPHPEMIFSPALLGDLIARYPLPLDHPPC